ncbi:PIN-like domain-containing protein [Pseudomonas sp. K1(2024)]|uniref:PIN-like domain-containing protein n=1 Tax=Pseudomonas boreofloridensis TaxID=3064348 RepID=A0ABV4Z7H3_9PSED|nr:PIN domain-containing protein [Pseudomonas sp. K13]MDO7902989.1 PIN domain-containing protein [Pseudomonas sp. K13]
MKSIFPEFKTLTEKEYQDAWKRGLLVFDTNVLLNFYRYQAATRDELINVLKSLSKRIWIPHHVALEFYRNRSGVIFEQFSKYKQVREIVSTSVEDLHNRIANLNLRKRHSSIKTDDLQSKINEAMTGFLDELKALEEANQPPTSLDFIKDTIEQLFEGRVGASPTEQKEIDSIYKLAQARYDLKIPPGYKDKEKDKGQTDEYLHNGIFYKRKYGDYLVWRQMLEYAKSADANWLIYITDDRKEDWWLKGDSNKVLGPRPELINEAISMAGVRHFLMYSPEQFLSHAKQMLKASVSDETLTEVRDISDNFIKPSRVGMDELHASAKAAVENWVAATYPYEVLSGYREPDFVIYKNDKNIGIIVEPLPSKSLVAQINRRLPLLQSQANYQLSKHKLDAAIVVYTCLNELDIEETTRQMRKFHSISSHASTGIIVGHFNPDSHQFFPKEWIVYDDLMDIGVSSPDYDLADSLE